MCDITADGDNVPGSEKIIDVDFVCIAGGLYPFAELASVIGCPFQYVEELGGHVPVHNEQMETPLRRIICCRKHYRHRKCKSRKSTRTLGRPFNRKRKST